MAPQEHCAAEDLGVVALFADPDKLESRFWADSLLSAFTLADEETRIAFLKKVRVAHPELADLCERASKRARRPRTNDLCVWRSVGAPETRC